MLCRNPYVRKENGIITVLDPETRGHAAPFGCGQCLPCRINKQRELRAKIILESKTHPKSSFYTMTFSDENLPRDKAIKTETMQKFVKRLRKHIYPDKVRYFIVGEYGEKNGRPHYHAMLFGLGMEDKPRIDKAWKLGMTQIGDINSKTAHYVTDYTLKGRLLDESSVAHTVKIQSTKPALGMDFIYKIADQIVASGMVPPSVDYFQMGKHKYYLGRHLREAITERLGNGDRSKLQQFIHVSEQMRNHDVLSPSYRANCVLENESKAKLQTKRNHIHRKRRPL